MIKKSTHLQKNLIQRFFCCSLHMLYCKVDATTLFVYFHVRCTRKLKIKNNLPCPFFYALGSISHRSSAIIVYHFPLWYLIDSLLQTFSPINFLKLGTNYKITEKGKTQVQSQFDVARYLQHQKNNYANKKFHQN